MEDENKTKKSDVMEGKSPTLRVYARMKPLSDSETALISYSGREIISEGSSSSYRQHFSFSELFPPGVSQGSLFCSMVLPRLRDFLEGGVNQLIFTYGASSSGKTFTVQGTAAQPGILPRSLDVIFNSLLVVSNGPLQPTGFDSAVIIRSQHELQGKKREILSLGRILDADDEAEEVGGGDESAQSLASMFPSLRHREREGAVIQGLEDSSEGLYYSLWVSFAEIYNEHIYDLFEKVPSLGKKSPLRLAEDKRGCTYIKGLKEVPVSSADEAYQLLLIGRKNLRFADNKLNHNSSRSHCIFTIKLIKFCDMKEPRYGRVSILSFCDLAGSERIKKTHGTTQKETGNINASLLVLGRVMKTLRENQSKKQQSIVPYRDSKLTRLLQVYFKGLGQASMIVNISQSPHLFEETLQALKFAAITKKINYVKQQEAPSNNKRRRSTFSSILFQHKQHKSANLMGRGSIAWENPVISSTICPPPEDKETTNEDQESTSFTGGSSIQSENDEYASLNHLVEELQEKLRAEKERNISLESDIRSELCKEFNNILVKSESEWQRRLQDTTDRLEDLSEWRIATMENAYKEKCRKRKRYSEDDDDKAVSSRIATLESTLEGKEIELEENRKTLKALKETHGSLLASRQKLQEECTGLKFENTRVKSRAERLMEESLVLNKENKSKELAIESLTSSPIILDLRGQLADVKKKLANKVEEVGYLKKLLDEAGEEFLAKDEEVHKLNVEVESLKAESTQLSEALKDVQAECSDLISESAQRQEANDALEEQIIAFRKEINDLLGEKSQLILEVSDLKKESLSSCQRLERDVILKDSQETEKELNRRLGELENENKRLKAEGRSYQSMSEVRIEDLQSTLQNAMDTSEALLAKNKNLKSKMTLLESELEGKTSNRRALQNDVSVLETKEFERFEHSVVTEELEVSKKVLGEKEEDIREKERTILEKEELIGEKDNIISDREELISEKERIIANKEELIAGKERIIGQKEVLIGEKEGMIADKDATISEKEKLISSKEEELTQMASKLREVEGKLEKDLGPLTSDLEEKNRYICHLEDIIVDKNYEITLVEEKLADLVKEQEPSEETPNPADLEEKVSSLTEDVTGLHRELESLQATLEAHDKTLKKTQDEKARREKDLNDEIESLRTSKLKIKSSDDEKTKVLSEREVEVDRLQKEVKSLLQADGRQKERIEDQSSEIRTLEVQIKRLNEDSKDIEVLGKKIGEQQNFIDTLQSKLKAKEKEDNMIDILREELVHKNSERTALLEKVSKLESSSINGFELSRLQEKVSLLEREALFKDDEIRLARKEREDALNNFSKLIKAKEDELRRLKGESTAIRDVIVRSSSPSKALSSLKTELEKKEAFIKELEDCVEKATVVDVTEHTLKSEIQELKSQISANKNQHSKEIEKLKSANREVLSEYKAANRELHKDLGLRVHNSDEEESFQQSMLEADESLEVAEEPSSSSNRNRRSRKPGRKGRSSKKVLNSSPDWRGSCSPSTARGSENMPPLNNSSSKRRGGGRQKKRETNNEEETPRKRQGSKPKDQLHSELSSDNAFVEPPTPRRSTRKTLYNPGKLEVFSPVQDMHDTSPSPHTIVNRQLRTRRKK